MLLTGNGYSSDCPTPWLNSTTYVLNTSNNLSSHGKTCQELAKTFAECMRLTPQCMPKHPSRLYVRTEPSSLPRPFFKPRENQECTKVRGRECAAVQLCGSFPLTVTVLKGSYSRAIITPTLYFGNSHFQGA